VLSALRSRGVELIVLDHTPERLALQIGTNANAVLAIEVSDPDRRAFAVSYPALRPGTNRRRHVEQVHSEGVVVEGVLWIARQLAEHGAVTSEFR
jgi:hypothetical protein